MSLRVINVQICVFVCLIDSGVDADGDVYAEHHDDVDYATTGPMRAVDVQGLQSLGVAVLAS